MDSGVLIGYISIQKRTIFLIATLCLRAMRDSPATVVVLSLKFQCWQRLENTIEVIIIIKISDLFWGAFSMRFLANLTKKGDSFCKHFTVRYEYMDEATELLRTDVITVLLV